MRQGTERNIKARKGTTEDGREGSKEGSKERRKEGRKEDHYGGMQDLIQRNVNERIAPEKEVIIFVPFFFVEEKYI